MTSFKTFHDDCVVLHSYYKSLPATRGNQNIRVLYYLGYKPSSALDLPLKFTDFENSRNQKFYAQMNSYWFFVANPSAAV